MLARLLAKVKEMIVMDNTSYMGQHLTTGQNDDVNHHIMALNIYLDVKIMYSLVGRWGYVKLEKQIFKGFQDLTAHATQQMWR